MSLTPKLRQALKAKAHALKPVVLIGQQGLTDAVKKEIDAALMHHELIKVRIRVAERDEKKAMFAEICQVMGAQLVQQIGKMGVIYRQREER
ncbi:MAG: RNA-binding protein [Gammaproteobacteria bacterium RIFCSPHIGHO2_12_FULL_45_12]|nr:MAG: RNA-binding protein [Gammaproteobacteria bacterium RIFCSPHIGHO2_12_FULL_45_12]